MKSKFNLFFCTLVILVMVLSCRPKQADYSDFDKFYEKFLQDSLFQVQHINFPLDGLPDNAVAYGDSVSDFRWTAENWRMHRPIDFEKTKFEQNFQTLGDELILENIIDPSAGYGMLRRWAKIGGEWSLIYYVGLNPVQEKQ
ncbi:MAG: hypothetical protein SFV55_11480 [Haliscomenobacter sp.]|uniref:hypothetical protein n=1 Tax=Haliscomenobacter sp. TaxID=2717303 RepID=UPI0029A77CD3|nr:hypothetical protein [Haliscomenobacter sp.]MDX2069038.1 hypothetical protein [Haliscomenobacter sp.]